MILDTILEHKRQEVAQRKVQLPVAELIAQARDQEKPRDFHAAIKARTNVRLIAEMKKASPSAGVIRGGLAPGNLAAECEKCGADAISVLTDERFFQGSLDYVAEVKGRVGIPVLRKEFIVDEYQVYESRAAGADALLLIVRAVSGSELKRLHDLTRELGMHALVEVHSEREAETALAAGVEIIGINNRDLETFKTDISTTVRLRKLLGDETTVVSESGISTRDDVELLEQAGVDAVLVGEAIMRSADVGAKVKELLGGTG